MNKLPFKSSSLAPDSAFVLNKNCLIQGQGGTDTARAYKLTLKLSVSQCVRFTYNCLPAGPVLLVGIVWRRKCMLTSKYVNMKRIKSIFYFLTVRQDPVSRITWMHVWTYIYCVSVLGWWFDWLMGPYEDLNHFQSITCDTRTWEILRLLMGIERFLLNLHAHTTGFCPAVWRMLPSFHSIRKKLSNLNLWQLLRVGNHPSEEDWNPYKTFCQHCHVPSSFSSTTHDYWSFQQRTSFVLIFAELWWMSSQPRG